MSAQEVSSVLNYGMTKTHQIPIDHLDYSFIEKCSDIKHLEKILWVLRSGEEGHYPELTVFCEERLGNLAPQSRALRKDKPPATAADFSLEDWRNIDNDLKEWLVDIKMKAQNESVIQPDTENLPSVRSYHSLPADKKQRGKEKTGVSKKVPRDYRDWDRFDVEKELSQVEDDAERKEQSKTITHSKTSAIKKTINAAGLSMTQRRFIAENEKGKGNEAFRSGDYQEAITYYSRSISVLPSAAAYNNRAQAEIKLNNWQNALNDCERVLELDPGNTKAFLRRAITHKNLANYKAAETDLRRVLCREPDNPVAKKAFTDVEELLQKAEEETQSKGRKIVIEDIEGSDEEYNRPSKCEKEAGVSAGEQSDMGNAQNKPFPKKNSPRSKECGAPSHSPNGVKKDCGNGQQPRNPCEEKDSLNQHTTENTSKRGSKEVKPSAEPLSSAAQLKSEGNQLFKNGQFADAAVKYSEAIGNVKHTQSENAEELAILHSNRAACHLKDGNSRECIEDCNRSLELQPFSVKPLLRRAMANESLERYRPAYVDYKTVLQIDSSIQVAHDSINRIARTLIEQDGPNWREKLPQIPTVPVSIHLQQHGGGDPASNSSQPKSHVEHGKSPEEMLQALKTEGNEYVKKGKYREAEKKYSECLKINAEECTLYTNRALCYLKLSQYEEARSDCECALQIDTLNIKALYRRAQAYKGLEDYQACANDLQKVISVDPSITEAKKLLDEIAPFLAAADDINKGQEKQRKKILIEEVNEADVDGEVSNNNHCNGQESAALAAKPRSPITRPANAYEFSQQLNEIKAMKDETACADLLSVIEPKDLPVLMSNKLEEDILLLIVRSMQHCLLPTAPGLVYQHLSHLSKAERFKIVVMLLSKNQKDEIQDLFDSLTQNQNGDMEREAVLSLAREYEL
ncbi:sperm-associated antigen 1 isoform X1 [Xenopus laevis]|nr:sperm-associated antigen 1 isoform X1 [Xenopus laevis]